jgi:hypothetical protein
MGEQLSLFGAPAPVAEATCGFHGAELVCDQCPDGWWTDPFGFPKDKRLKKQTPCRLCPGCLRPITRMGWHTSMNCCMPCAAKGVDGREGL